MKVSDAMDAGWQITPPQRGVGWVGFDPLTKELYGACAVGAAGLGAGLAPADIDYNSVVKALPQLQDQIQAQDVPGQVLRYTSSLNRSGTYSLGSVIQIMHDVFSWRGYAIVDWVRSKGY